MTIEEPYVSYATLGPGDRLAGALIREKIADGTVGAVYRAERDERTVALKVLDPLRSADPVGRQRFRREFELLSGLDHPGLVRVYDFVSDRGLDVLVMECVEGPTLEARLAGGRLEIEVALAITRGLLEAVIVCHDRGIWHRDLKPANIVLHPDRGPVILDFGVAWFGAATQLTRTGALIGSPRHLAPEIFAGGPVDARVDLYALGTILFEMLSGRPPYLVDSVAELALAHRRGAAPAIRSLRPEIAPRIADLVTAALARAPEDRPATAREFVSHLDGPRRGDVALLERNLPCERCHTPLILGLGFCPGCGHEVSWSLDAGDYAVQLTAPATDPNFPRWLEDNYGQEITSSFATIKRRLELLPVPLLVGASLATAERIAAEARRAGARPEILCARSILGAKLDFRAATLPETLVALGMHFAATKIALWIFVLFRFPLEWIVLIPLVLGFGSVALAANFIRRPLLRTTRRRSTASAALDAERTGRLAGLRHDRARRLAAAAIARAVPLFGGRLTDQTVRTDVEHALDEALTSAAIVDLQLEYLSQRSRAKLAIEVAQAEAELRMGADEAPEKLARLEGEKRSLIEAAVAHDLAARQALEATAAISAAIDRAPAS